MDLDDMLAKRQATESKVAENKKILEAKAEGWDAAIEYVKTELNRFYLHERKSLDGLPQPLTNALIQPCFDAIDGAGTMTYRQYNAHISSVELSAMIDWFTYYPAIYDENGEMQFEAVEDDNPYRQQLEQ